MKEKVEKAIATLIACTRRKKRPKSIIEIAHNIEFLKNELGSYKAVGETIGLSTEMLREFRSVKFLTPKIQILINKRVIDSVDLVYRISKLDDKGQEAVVATFLKNDLTGDNARAVKTFKKRSGKSTQHAISKIIKSRNIKTYKIEFGISKESVKSKLRKKFEKIVARNEIVSFEVENGKAILELSYQGQKNIREAARKENTTLREFVKSLLKEP